MEMPLDLLYLQLDVQIMCIYFEIGSITCSAIMYCTQIEVIQY